VSASLAAVAPQVQAQPVLEWWQRWAIQRAAWWRAHPILASRLAQVRSVVLWGGLVLLVGVVVFAPDLRLALRAYLGCVWVVVVWYLAARTKTLTWSGFMRFFAACLPWSFAVGLASRWITVTLAELDVTDPGAKMAVAAIAEETLKLVPLALVAVLAPRRTSRFAAIDWLLLGLASGTAFLVVEEGARRIGLATGRLGLLDAWLADGGVPLGWIQFGLWPVPTTWNEGGRAYGGHAIVTAIVAGLVGLSIVALRSARGRRGLGAVAARTTAVAVPVLALFVAIADHAVLNGGGPVTCTGDTPCWLDPTATHVPWWIRVPWSLFGHGHGRATVLLVLAVVLLCVDGARLAQLPAAGLTGSPRPRWIDTAARGGADLVRTWPAPIRTSVAVAVFAALGTAWVVVRDLVTSIAAFAAAPGEHRRVAARRGAGLLSAQRAAREMGIDAWGHPAHPRRQRAAATAALVGLLLGALVLAPTTAQGIGTVYDSPYWLAGVLNAVAGWWHSLSPGQQIAIGAAIAALVVLSGGSLGLAMGISGVATWGLDKSAGISTFIQDPDQATRSYLATTTPAGLLADTAGVALTFAPGNFGGALAARGLRTATEDLLADPAAFWAGRRLSLADDAGVLDLGAFMRKEPAALGDGSIHLPLEPEVAASELAKFDALPPGRPLGGHDLGTKYQLHVTGGAPERVLTADGREWHLDGFTSQYGAITDAKYAGTGSFYAPQPGSGLEGIAVKAIDKTLRAQAAAARAFDGTGVFEIATNTPASAAFIESRITELGLPGYVRLVPFGG